MLGCVWYLAVLAGELRFSIRYWGLCVQAGFCILVFQHSAVERVCSG